MGARLLGGVTVVRAAGFLVDTEAWAGRTLPHGRHGKKTVVNGWTVGAGHFNMLEVPEQVNSMIAGFLRHHV